MERIGPISRRNFCKLGAVAGANFLIATITQRPAFTDSSEQDDNSNIFGLKPTSLEGNIISPDETPLEKYLREISFEKHTILTRLQEYQGNPLRGIKDLTKERILEDIDIYFPFYKAGEISYQVPWSLLWIIHTHETTNSTDPNTYVGENIGAMQRNYPSWSMSEVNKAAEEWEFLQSLPQRFPDDWKEIIWAASYLKRFAKQPIYTHLSNEEAVLEAVRYNYSNVSHGIARAKKYNELKALLQINPSW